MKRFKLAPPLFVLLLVSSFATADSVPIFNLTQGSVTAVSDLNDGIEDVWSFSNSGISIMGSSYYFPTCLNFMVGGVSCNPSIVVAAVGLPLPNTGSVSGSNNRIYFGGPGINISGASFVPPIESNLTSFSVTMPVLFSGSFNACVMPASAGGPDCYDPITQTNNPVFAIFNVNGPGIASLTFTSYSLPGPTVWRMSSGTYTLTSAPEPSSIALLGTGAVGLIAAVRRRLWR